MAYIKNSKIQIGSRVILTVEKRSMAGFFEVGSIVTITAEDPERGYTFEDDEGNRVIEAGFSGFTNI